MHVKLTTGRVIGGPIPQGQAPGEIIKVSDAEGQRLIASGQAEEVQGKARPESATDRGRDRAERATARE